MVDLLKDIVYPIAQILYDKKALNILSLDVIGLSTMTDYLVIAEGNVNKHVSSMAVTIIHEMQSRGIVPSRVEGLSAGDWVVIDFEEVVVHIFEPGLRERYCLERLYPESKIIDLPLILDKTAINH